MIHKAIVTGCSDAVISGLTYLSDDQFEKEVSAFVSSEGTFTGHYGEYKKAFIVCSISETAARTKEAILLKYGFQKVAVNMNPAHPSGSIASEMHFYIWINPWTGHLKRPVLGPYAVKGTPLVEGALKAIPAPRPAVPEVSENIYATIQDHLEKFPDVPDPRKYQAGVYRTEAQYKRNPCN